MKKPSLLNNTPWLYGVIVGIAIKEALEAIVPHWTSPAPEIGFFPEVLRLAVFLVLIVRFYLGSLFFFNVAHGDEMAPELFPKRNYSADFLFGLVQFIAFLILAITIDIHTTRPTLFFFTINFILISDLFWFVFSFRQSTSRLIFWETIVNVITALLTSSIYLLVVLKSNNYIIAERWALWPILFVSLLDLGLMMSRRPFFEPLGSQFLLRFELDPAEPTPAPAEPIPE